MNWKEKVNVEVLCDKVLGCTGRNYRKLASKGHVPATKDGQVVMLSAVKKYIEYIEKKAKSKSSTLTEEKTRLTRAQAEKAEHDLAKAKSSVVEVDHAMQLWGKVIMAIRQKMLAIPVKLSPLILGLKTIPETKVVVQKFIHEVLTELANPDLRKIDSARGNGRNSANTETTADVNNKPMGRSKKGAKSRSVSRSR